MDTKNSILIERKVRRFYPLGLCRKLAERLFQKAPDLLQDLDERLSTVQGAPQGLYVTRSFICDRISGAVNHIENYGLPNKLESYVAFLDLAWIVYNVEERNKINWNTFALLDFDVRYL